MCTVWQSVPCNVDLVSSRTRKTLKAVGATTGALTGVGAGCLAYAGLYEVNAFRLQTLAVRVLPPGANPIRALHITDIHMVPAARARQRWLSGLADLKPDLVINTGDNLAHRDAVPYVVAGLGELLSAPGVYVWGSNDYYAPSFKNPLKYFARKKRPDVELKPMLPWRDLDREFKQAGWIDLTHTRETLVINGVRLGFRGTDDAHLEQDRYVSVAGPIDRTECDAAIGVTHSPYRRVLDAMTSDGHDLIMAGHTHGGQVCVPGYGAVVTNCDLDRGRAKGLSRYEAAGRETWLHVSAGLGTSPYAPIRFACPPEATLLTLTARD